jgi:DNA-binding transcriptional LysR family regulator
MIDLNDFRYLVAVADCGGFSPAARVLQRPTSTISYRIQQLENELGTALLVRNSRRVGLTDAGQTFYQHAIAMLERADDAEAAVRHRSSEPAGIVRYTVSVAAATFAMPEMVQTFLAKFPKVQLVQDSNNDQLDVVAGRYDLAIRAHSRPLSDSTLVQRRLAHVPWHLFASPAYLRSVRPIRNPSDLVDHSALVMKRGADNSKWDIRHATKRSRRQTVIISPRLTGACMMTLKKAAQSGTGVVALPAYVCRDAVTEGTLMRVLPDWIANDSQITAIMPSRRGVSAAARAFIDHIAAAFPHATRATD